MAELTPEQKAAAAEAGLDPNKAATFLEKTRQATIATSDFNTELKESSGVLDDLNNKFAEYGLSLDQLGNLTGASAAKFGLLTTFIAGAKEEFKGFVDVGKAGGIGTIGESLNGLMATVKQQGTAFGVAGAAAMKLRGMLTSMGAGGKELDEALRGGVNGLIAFGKNFVTSADNALRFQSGLMKAAAAGGNLKGIYEGVGTTFNGVGNRLENLNKVTSHFHNIMGQAMKATGIESVDVMGNLTMELIKTTAGLESMTKGMDIAGVHTDTLTGIIHLAHGAQLDVLQTIQDVGKVTSQYGLNTEDATKAVMRQVDVAGDLQARQEDVHEAVFKTLSTFKNYTMLGTDATKMTQGLTDSVKNWAQSLKNVGVPIQSALEMAAKYTAQLQGMDEAQASFVSQSTGGPGGLAGTFDFEDLIRTGKTQEATAKVAETMRQQLRALGGTGQIISREQARTMGDAGKEQFERQRVMMMSGLLGVKPGSREEGEQMMAALAQGGDIFGKKTTEEQKNAVLADTMEKGKAQEQLAFTAVKEANIKTELVRLQAGTINLQGMQNAATARSGGIEATGVGIGAQQPLLKQRMGEGDLQAKGPGTGMAIKDIVNVKLDATKHMAFTADSARRQLTSAPTENDLLKQAGMTAPRGGAITPDQKQKMIEDEMRRTGKTKDQVTASLESAMKSPDATSGTGAQLTPSAPVLSKQSTDALTAAMHRGSPTASRQVGQAIPPATTAITTGTSTATTGGAPGLTAGPGGPVPVTLAPGTAITVNFSGTCLHCGRPMHQNEHGLTNNAASGASNKGVP